MRFPNLSNQPRENSVQSLLFMALLLLASIAARADEFDDQKDHFQQLIDHANHLRDTLGPDLVDALSHGGALFATLGDKADLLMGALDAARLASNPLDSDEFISRLAGVFQSEPSVAWCGRNAIIGFNDSGNLVRTLFPPSPSPSGSLSYLGWSVSTDAGKSFTDNGILLPDPIPPGTRKLDLFGDPVVRCADSATFYYASIANHTTISSGTFSAISVSKSVNGGASFGGAKIVAQKPSPLPPATTVHMLDKDWMAVKRISGVDHIHITYTDAFNCGGPYPP